MKFVPLHDFIHVRKCVNEHVKDENGSVLLYMTDQFIDTTNMAEVLAVGPDCKYDWRDAIGKFVLCPEFSRGMFCVGKDEFVIREQTLETYGVFAIFSDE
jgi:co-chaperonin GroES (HSP10)